ncbi:MAG TPA: hypothetical protein VG319_13370 [Polyangia bacterium]|jgi:hypothetical protein|nr:hypothetical protein [Polyangia bacterium]
MGEPCGSEVLLHEAPSAHAAAQASIWGRGRENIIGAHFYHG